MTELGTTEYPWQLTASLRADTGHPCVLFSDKVMVIRAVIHKILGRIANREDHDQTASSEAV